MPAVERITERDLDAVFAQPLDQRLSLLEALLDRARKELAGVGDRWPRHIAVANVRTVERAIEWEHERMSRQATLPSSEQVLGRAISVE